MNHIKLDIQNEPTGQTVPLNANILYQCQRRLSIFFNRKLHFFRIFHRACRKSGDTPPSAQGAGQRCYPFALRDLSAPECGVSLTHLPVPVPDGSYARQYLCRSVLMSVGIHVGRYLRLYFYAGRSVFVPVGIHMLPSPAVGTHILNRKIGLPTERFFRFFGIGIAFGNIAGTARIHNERNVLSRHLFKS